jgi:hypothetical protein
LIQGKASCAGLPTLAAMRRVLLVCLLLMLPLQGAWGAMAGIRAFELPCAAAGHAASPPTDLAPADATDVDAATGPHGAMPDCGGPLPDVACDGSCSDCAACSACHGTGLVALLGTPPCVAGAGQGFSAPARQPRGAPDHVPEPLLRPPLPQRP